MTPWYVILGIGIILAFGSQFLRQHWILTPIRMILFWLGMILIANSVFMWFASGLIEEWMK